MSDAILLLVNSYCNIDSAMNLSLTSKYLNETIFYEWKRKHIKPFTLTVPQYIFSLKVHKAFRTDRICVVSAPMGWGKTLMAIYYIITINTTSNVLIVVPPTVLKVWMEELIKTGLISPKPKDSKVLVMHSTRPAHQKYHSADTMNHFIEHRIILTTNKIAHKVYGNVDLIVIDEYHKTKHYSTANAKILGLTAELVESDNNTRVLAMRDITFSEKIPDVQYNYYYVDNERDANYCKYGIHIEDVTDFEEDYKYQFYQCISAKNKVVISVDHGEIGKLVREWVTEMFPMYKVYELLSSTKTIDAFTTINTNAILFIGANNNEGLNILAEHILMVKPDIMLVKRIKQTLGRLRRPNNPHRTITCNFLVGGKIAVLKSYYAACYANTNWTLSYEDTPDERFLLKCLSMAGLLGYKSIIDFPMVDGCVLFDAIHTTERCEEILEWWTRNKTEDSALNEDMIRGMYV